MKGVHDVFPADEEDKRIRTTRSPTRNYSRRRQCAMWALTKDILRFTFDGEKKTLWLEAPKREKLLGTLKQWLRQARKGKGGIPFDVFHYVMRSSRFQNATNATLKLGNQKNGWKEVCINHEHILDDINCGLRAIGRLYCHIWRHANDPNTPLFFFHYFVNIDSGTHIPTYPSSVKCRRRGFQV